jgi:RimJ/RimL family protein N-acetyltransferase
MPPISFLENVCAPPDWDGAKPARCRRIDLATRSLQRPFGRVRRHTAKHPLCLGLVKIDKHFRAERTLLDGTSITLRLLRPEDREALRRAFARLSSTTRYLRFLQSTSELSDEMLDYLTKTDGIDHLAIAAVTDSLDLKQDVGLGIARFVRLAGEPTVAEVAVTVVDDMQGKGLGRMLLQILAEAALERNVHTFRAEVLSNNAPVRKILTQVGATIHSDNGETLVFDVPLDSAEDVESRVEHPLRRMLRAAAESMGLVRSQ